MDEMSLLMGVRQISLGFMMMMMMMMFDD